MALHRFNLLNRPTSTDVASQRVDDTTAALATLTAASADVTAAVAAAQLIGAGDASAEVDAIDTAQQAEAAALAAVSDPTSSGHMVILIDTTAFTTRTQIRDALDRFMSRLAQFPGLFTP